MKTSFNFYVLPAARLKSCVAAIASRHQIRTSARAANSKDLNLLDDVMGKVLATFQIMPKGTEVDLKKVTEAAKKLNDIGQVKEIKEEPVAFGLKCLKLLTMIDDAGGITEKIEAQLKKISGVEDARCIDVTLA